MPAIERILTTHVGSLPRPPEVVELLRRQTRGEAYAGPEFERLVAEEAAAHEVEGQARSTMAQLRGTPDATTGAHR